MKVSSNQSVILRGESKKYQCEGCAFWIEGIGNWGGCAIVAPIEGEVAGLHIHRKASCKYWQKPSDNSLAQDSDVNRIQFSKPDSLYGATAEKAASPLGFSCKTCEYWRTDKTCAKFDGAFEEYDCSDGWHPSAEANAAIKSYDDKDAPKSAEEAVKLSEIYGPHIGSELKRSLTDAETEIVFSLLKSKNFEEIEDFYKARGFPVGTKRTWSGIEYVKQENGEWVSVSSTHSKSPDNKQPVESDNPQTDETTDKNQYEFARASDFENLGEDLKGSARHKRNEWKGLVEAEKDGTAAKQVVRDNLLKEMPIDLVSKTNYQNYMTNMVGYSLLRKYPKAPEYPSGKDSGDYYRDSNGSLVPEAHYEKYYKDNGRSYERLDGEMIRRDIRKRYYDTFIALKTKIESAKFENIHLKDMATDYRAFILGKIKDLRAGNRYDPLANQLVPLLNNGLKDWGNFPKTSAFHDMTYMMKELQKKYGEDYKNKISEINDQATEVAKEYMSGKSIEKALGENTSKEKFDPSSYYIKDRSERVGPDLPYHTKEEQENALLNIMQIRGVQWGNSVTDDERKHHLAEVANAMSDLTEVLNLPPEMASFNGKLGLAIGARGKGSALAHYEPSSKVINLTRANGVGSLSHEWGHFFDNTMSNLFFDSNSNDGYMSEYTSDIEIRPTKREKLKEKGLEEFSNSFKSLNTVMDKMSKRISGDKDALDAMELFKGYGYWLSREELFARSFERYVGHKLEKNGRKNTYLTANVKHVLWPTESEIEEMTPHFDAIFKHFSESTYLKKSLEKYFYADRKDLRTT